MTELFGITINQVDSDTAGKGLKVTFIGHRPEQA